MIIIKEMSWGNWFSYGDNNNIIFNKEKVTQIIGKNGSGKSSIPVILGEVLCNKNALGKTKAKLSNRYIEGKPTWAELWFDKDNDEYRIDYSRKSTLKLALYKNGVDISSHSTTNTYATIQKILGYEFKTLWGLMYQSSKEGLEFLTATDSNRKKFLIKIFNLSEYLHIHEHFKKLAAQENTKLQVLQGKISTIESWIEKNEKEDLVEKALKDVPNIDTKDVDAIADLKVEIANIHDSNKKINDNNQLKTILDELDTSILSENIPVPTDIEILVEKCNEHNNIIAINNNDINTAYRTINEVKELEDKCPVCKQDIDTTFKSQLINDDLKKIKKLESTNLNHQALYNSYQLQRTEAANLMARQAEKDRVGKELTELISKIDNSLPSEVFNENDLNDKIFSIETKLNDLNAEIQNITKGNLQVESHNSRVEVIKGQLIEYRKQFNELNDEGKRSSEINVKLNIIKKAYSPNGLLSYKIEHLSTDLEDQINFYLADLSKGRFQLAFTIAGEKLNIEIIDDGCSITVEELSAGELARVNTATLLAIRKLMAAISSSKINLLFLDEILAVLDNAGKETLIDILLEEEDLNTFLVSHEYSNPLIPQLHIIKEDKISRIET